MLGADVVVTELLRLTQRKLQHLLGARGKGDMPGRRLLPLADNLLDLLAHGLETDPQGFQGLRRHAFTLVDEAQQDVLGADVVVIEHPGFFLSQDHNPPRPVGKPLEHIVLRTASKHWPPTRRLGGAAQPPPEIGR